MPNTKPYNKEEVMKEFNNRYVEMSPLHGRDMHNRPPLYDTNLAEVFDMSNFLSQALTAAEQAGEERIREKVLKCVPEEKSGMNGEGVPFENSPEIYGNARVEAFRSGFNSARSQILNNLEALK